MSEPMSAQEIWDKTYQLLLDQPLELTPREAACLTDISATNMFGTMIVLTVSNEFTRTVIEKKLHASLTAAFAQVTGQTITFVIQIDPDVLARQSATTTQTLPRVSAEHTSTSQFPVITAQSPVVTRDSFDFAEEPAPVTTTTSLPIVEAADAKGDMTITPTTTMSYRDEATHLNKNARFDNFVPGDSNKFAKNIALAAAERPGLEYNPLFIYGASGLGKTHLLNAIGNHALLMNPHLRVRYTNSEEMTNEFVYALEQSRHTNTVMNDFNHRYRDVDILLVDDIQFIAGRDATVEWFFNTFNELYENGKQIAIVSDVAPKNLKGLPDRLISRFNQGLPVNIDPPAHELRVAILRMKAKTQHVDIPMDVLDLIAEKVTDNVRELEGALTRVVAMSSLNNKQITKSLAEQTLSDYTNTTIEITPANIITSVANYYKLTFDDVVGSSRTKNVAQARQVAMYMSRELTSMSLVDIGAIFGGRDHSTVMHACRKIVSEMSENMETFNAVKELTAHLKQNGEYAAR
ncbi:chromosomal replication initiator protein DnaA [Alloscardovia venturai]|uniref:Chromosomal replication initiator protein DnaA n=1 Tax=Alloscardovia venturai TaxID=1769421 RepID=A0ABW2Y434_9BIFI